jgi:hypothetical protein
VVNDKANDRANDRVNLRANDGALVADTHKVFVKGYWASTELYDEKFTLSLHRVTACLG